MHEQDSAWRREYAEQGQQPVSAGAPVSGGTASHGTAAPHGTAPSHGTANGSTTASLPASGYQPASSYQQPHFNYSPTDPNGPTGQWPPYQGPAAPPPATPGYPVETQRGSGGSGGRIALIAVGALALALVSGTIGGVVVRAADGNTTSPTQTVTRAAAPQVDRSSVAGVAEAVLPSVVDITTQEGEGSGVVMSADGYIVTNNHVVEGASGNTVNVTFNSGKTAKATIVGTDPVGDIAVIKAQGVTGLTVAKFGDSDSMRVGDTVLAIGSPLGLQGSVSEGIISALHRTIQEGAEQGSGNSGHSISDALQTDAAINPGNSGGALINLAGEVVGINTAIASTGQQAGNIGVGFAISSNKVKSAAEQLQKGQKVTHPYLGVQLTDADNGGALIADVVSGGPADKAGLQKGDVVTKANGQDIADATALINAVQAGKTGDQLQLTVNRNGSVDAVTVTLGDTP
jgi:putative serine protease PepD